MTQEIIFKECSVGDIDDLIVISQQFYPQHYTHVWKNNDPSYYINLSFTKAAFEKDFSNNSIQYFSILKADKTLGLLKIRKHQSINHFDASKALQLEKIYLLQSSTGLGIGKKGIDFTKNYALQLHKSVIWLDVMSTSPALTFYKKMGFKTVSLYHLDYPGLKTGYTEMQRMLLQL